MFTCAMYHAIFHVIQAPACAQKWIGATLMPLLTMGLLGLSPPSRAAEWADIPATEVVFIYPGQISLQWLLDPAIHKGAKKFRTGERECRDCHAWNLEDVGEKILHSSILEPTPPANRRSSVALKARMRIVDDAMQVRLEWPAATANSTSVQSGADTRITLLLDDRVASFSRAGCWAACHADSRTMPADNGRNQDKYLIHSRSRMGPTGGGTGLKPAADLNASITKGEFLEFWQATLNPGKPAFARSGYLLEKRHYHGTSHVSADATFSQGRWVTTLSRPLSAPAPDFKSFQPGVTYTVGFALHDQFTAGRFHLVSYPYTFRIDGDSIPLKPVQTEK